MIVPSVRVQSRVPGLEETSLVIIDFETSSDLDVFKVYVAAEMADKVCNFGVLVKTCHCSFWDPQFRSLMTFLFGYGTQNYTMCN